jgi:hypothetical protein
MSATTVIDEAELPVFLIPPELAELRRTTTSTLAQERYLGRGVPFIRDGRRILYARADVLAYLERNRVTQVARLLEDA